ncbi:DUF5666 domain-containing protein [Glaciecola sp. SC05]|uniref:DUF5666 domain-containing protein n=1 Tax=Glaciecola sp. SC05 TaxID=1987355 RepID=UPI003527ED4F
MKMQKKHILGTMIVTSLLYACGGSGSSSSEAPQPAPAPSNGALSVAIVGLPAGAQSSVTVAGPNGFTSNVSGNTTLSDLAPGTYTLTTSPVSVDNIEFDVLPATVSLTVSANNTAAQELVYMTDVLSAGVISNFGSVYVNGVRYSTDDASVETDDNDNASEDDLSVGMTVSIQGRQTADAAINSASKISHFVHAEGPLDAVSLSENELVVFGQAYQVDSRTIFDDTSFVALQVGDIVEISAIKNEDDTWLATYVDLENSQDSFKLKGEVSNLNDAEQQFSLGSVIVDFSQATTEATLVNGLYVKVESNQSVIDGVLLADEIEVDNSNDDSISGRVDVDGVISEITANGFSLSGSAISWSESTDFVAGTSASLAVGIRVKVNGIKTDNGIVAERVRFDKQGEIDVEGLLQAVDLENNTITILDTVFVVDEFSQLKDDSDLDIRRFSLSQLNIGDLIEVEAFASGDSLVVKKMEREETAGSSDRDDHEAKLKGSVLAIDGTSLQLQGALITTGQFTEYELGDSDVSADTFFAQIAAGDWIEVEGIRQADGSFLATEIETGSSSSQNGDDQSGGVEFEGVITDFNSIESFTVNGRLITTNDRTIFRDQALSILANGVRVEIYGREADNGDILATRVKIEDGEDSDDFDIEIKGVLDANAANDTMVINQQVILFDSSTRFSDGSAADLLQGTFVEVDAILDENGALYAYEIDIENSDDQSDVEINGVISEILENNEIVVAGVTIVLTNNTEYENGSANRLDVGLYVEVEGRFNEQQKLIADELEFGESERNEIEGSIGQVLSDTQFTLGNLTVQHDRFTKFEDGSVADILPGVEVELKGFINEDGIFIAEKIEFSDD